MTKSSSQTKQDNHAFTKKICHWDYCRYCGLVALRNEPTQQAIKLGCNWYEIMYPHKMKK